MADSPDAGQLLAHAGFVRALARGVLGRDDQVDDVLQETWLVALTRVVPGRGRIRSWLGSVGRRRALDLRRRETTRARHERHAVERASPLSPDELAERAEAGRLLTAAVLALPDAYRDVLLYRYFQDLTPAQIAAQTGEPVETVRTRLKRGLAKVREALEREGGADRWVAVLVPWAMPALRTGATSAALTAAAVLLALGVSAGILARSGSARPAPRIAAEQDRGAQAVLRGREAPVPAAAQPGSDSARLPPAPDEWPEPLGAVTMPVPLGDDVEPKGTLVYAGVVVDEHERPLADAEVWLELRHERPGGFGIQQRLAPTRTDAAGRFRFASLPPGRYDVHATAADHEQADAVVELFADRVGASFSLRPGFDVHLVVREPEGWPRSMTFLQVRASEGWERSIDGDAEDRRSFWARKLPAGSYLVLLRNITSSPVDGEPMQLDRVLPLVVTGPGQTRTLPFTADEVVELKVVLPERAAETSGLVTVVDGLGSRSDAPFRAGLSPDGTSWTRSPFARGPDSSAMAVPGMPTGKYRLRVSALEYETEELDLEVSGPRTLEVRLRRRPGRVVTAALDSPYWQVDARDASGAEPWRRILWQDGRVRVSHGDPAGVTTAYLSPGTYRFRVTSSRFVVSELEPVTVEDGAEPLKLALDPLRGAAVSGSLRAETDGRPVDGLFHVFRVDRGALERMPEKEAQVDDEGYRIEGLPPGRYRFSLSTSGEPYLAEIDVGALDLVVPLVLRGT